VRVRLPTCNPIRLRPSCRRSAVNQNAFFADAAYQRHDSSVNARLALVDLMKRLLGGDRITKAKLSRVDA